jgi:hypothetical protein
VWLWMRSYRAGAATVSGPGFCGWITGPASVGVAEFVTLSCLRPARQERAA